MADDKDDGAAPAQHSTFHLLIESLHMKLGEQKPGIGQPRRLELELEVSMLQKMLESEEKVHLVLEQAVIPRATRSSLHIPSFLPKKMKELLAEVVMVEEEIARLEKEIVKNKQGIQDTQESRGQMLLKSIQEEQHIESTIEHPNQLAGGIILSTEDKAIQEKLALETRPLFFINRAIKGDYTIHSFTNKEKISCVVKRKNMKRMQKPMENHERVPRKGGTIKNQMKNGVVEKPISPKLLPMHPLNNVSSKPSSVDKSFKEKYQKWQPNMLSEKIMKCLICIFIRLLRTSRVMELEKSRMANQSLRAGSFRTDASLNLKASIKTPRETAQQDPYGVFEVEGSLVRDIGPYKNLVRFTSSHADSKIISDSLSLLNKLRILLNELHEVDLRDLNHNQKLAFWINIHNACIMNGFLEHGFPSNPQKVIAVRNKAVLNIGGNMRNALDMENFILRQSSNIIENRDKHNKEDDMRSIYRLDHLEPNIAFALCRGHKSSPALKIYTSESILTELEKSKVEYLQASIVVVSTKRLMIPKLLLLNMCDFAEDLSSLLDWICQQLPTSGTLRKCITECLRARSNQSISDIVDVLPYNFELQYLLPM